MQVRAGLNSDGISVEGLRIDVRRIFVEIGSLAALEAVYLLIHVPLDDYIYPSWGVRNLLFYHFQGFVVY